MITGIDKKYITKELKKDKLPDYWGQYFSYEKDIELFELTQKALLEVVANELAKEKPYIDSKIVINNILVELGKKHNFHRQFNERHPNLHREQVLGMQLYKILVEDIKETWVYCEIQHIGHLFPNATYFM